MTYDEKLFITIEAINEARQFTRKDYFTKLHIGTGNGLSRIPIAHLHEILLQLQDDEKIIKIEELPTALKSLTAQTSDVLDGKKTYFLIDVLKTFDNWLIRYRAKQKSKPENLDWLNLLKALDVCSDIEQRLQISRSNHVSIPSFPYPYIGRFLELFPYDTVGTRKAYQQHRWDGVQYLIKQKVVLEAKHSRDETFGYGSIGIKVNLSEIDDFYKKIKREFEKRKKKADKIDKESVKDAPEKVKPQKVEQENEVMYQIIYTKQRQVLMNNAQISKPDFNSENDLVFSFLYKNPNKRLTLKEIEKAVGGKLTKSLHKIVENLGFEGDTKKVFFSVSKTAIEFRNPITKKDLEELKKPLIKLVKGGGKLVIPH